MEKTFRSETCEGHYCFISMTTSELSVENASLSDDPAQQQFVGVSRPRYEILAGCVKVDDDHVSVIYYTNMMCMIFIESEYWLYNGVFTKLKRTNK
jgi:hypothetical protein